MKNILKFIRIIIIALIIYSCEEKPTTPIVETIVVSEITATSAKSGGTISADGGTPIIACGVCWSTSNEPTISDSKTVDVLTAGSFTSTLTNLDGGKTYYVRAYATNSAGTSYGIAMSFTTLGQAPIASNSKATNLLSKTATLNGSVNASYLTTTVTFEYGTTTAYGNTKDAKQSPITGNNEIAVSADLKELQPGTIYHYRIKASNSLGNSYGEDMQFLTGVSDIEGNEYKTVLIGTQIWMAENLKSTKFNDNTDIPNVSDVSEWISITTGAFCWYQNDRGTYGSVYGGLYNGYSAISGKLCPTGWHVSTNTEMIQLIDFLGGKYIAGDKLKESGNTHWNSPSTSATNESGFTGLPGGMRFGDDGTFYHLGMYGLWWSSSENDSSIWYMWMNNKSSQALGTYTIKNEGYSVRCIKN